MTEYLGGPAVFFMETILINPKVKKPNADTANVDGS